MGISYEVVTKVKEFTETRRYGEALDLLEGEDIFQSLNPQFLRCCGEVYLENNRFYESREALVRAHIMAPEGNRIIYDLVHLYLKMGYFQRAKQYYEIYVHNAGLEDTGKLYLQYMIQKAQRVDASELVGILGKACEEQYSDEWGFELALLYASLGMRDKMKEECVHLIASFRKSPYCALAEALKKGEYNVNNSNFCFPIMEAQEDRTLYEAILKIEEKQLEKDELKVHPPDPVIIQMEDDDGSEEAEDEQKEKNFSIKLPFGKKAGKAINTQDVQEAAGDGKNEEAATKEAGQTVEENMTEKTEPEEGKAGSDDIAAYIEEIMRSVADIEASIAEDLQNPLGFQMKESPERERSGEEEQQAEEQSNAIVEMPDEEQSGTWSEAFEEGQEEIQIKAEIGSSSEEELEMWAEAFNKESIEADIDNSNEEGLEDWTEAFNEESIETDNSNEEGPEDWTEAFNEESMETDHSNEEQPETWTESFNEEPIENLETKQDVLNVEQTEKQEETFSKEKSYQPKLFEVEENLSPKERLEQLMKLIEEDKKEEENKEIKQEQESTMEQEVELDEFLMDLVGASAITQAMVKNYRDERDSEKWSDDELDLK